MVASRVNRVVRIVRETIPRLGNLGGSAQAYSVMATATDYLPEAIGGYLRLPRQWADSRPVDRGRTSLMLLIDQLDLLGSTMDKVFDAVNRADAAALIAHGRFLQEKFGTGSTGGGLALGATQSTPPPDTGSGPLQPPAGTRGGMSGVGGTSLQDALSALLAVAARAGVAEDVARAEALSLAAALAESAPGAPADWAGCDAGLRHTGLLRRRSTRPSVARRADRRTD